GGSIAAIDRGGALRVGPRSAGAVPGPVCYGTGEELTVTDANLLLGRLDPEFFLGGRMALDVARVRRIATGVAKSLKLSVEALAEGIVRVANANMERAIRVVSVERGHDPRAFSLVAFGGAGGMHACDIARELDISTVVVPRHAGVLSALGMLAADVTRDYSASVLMPAADISHRELVQRLAPLVRRGRQELAGEGFEPRQIRITEQIDVRYVGQSYEITLPFTSRFAAEFHRRHGTLYGYSNPDRAIEAVAVRVQAAAVMPKLRLSSTRPRTATARLHASRTARFDGASRKTAYFRWPDLRPGANARGPAVIAGPEATAVVPPGWRFRIDGFGNVIATRSSKFKVRSSKS
ncbi:MAG TPA: hydantoinase/oxoprolinase family protein, partial [Vicinamibacterales bacterium]|nr:hydantoinase/oxoprolinase family protein [Vicinamibacterales bacterium]